jgi:DNA-binding response OmpR family regulator
MNVLFYDDNEESHSNEILCDRLRNAIGKLNLSYVHSIERFESKLIHTVFDVFILDIMGPETTIMDAITGTRVLANEIGIELLKRLRNGKYPNQRLGSLIIIRTGKTDTITYNTCKSNGADDVFKRGTDDTKIVKRLKQRSMEISYVSK